MLTPKPSPNLPHKPLAQWLIRRVEFSIGGQAWPLLFTHRALLVCQDITGMDMLNASIAVPSANMLRALLFSALSVAGSLCSLNDVGRRIAFSQLSIVQQLVMNAWLASMPEPKSLLERNADVMEGHPLTWLDAWAVAREHHRLSDEAWLEMTPRQFSALQSLRMSQLQREELLVGIIAATTQNFSACHPDKAASAESFMLHKFPEPELVPITGEYIMAAMERSRRKR